MLRLIVARHAEAATVLGLPDLERPLTTHGEHDAARAGDWLRTRGIRPDRVLCSMADRTRCTWEAVAGALDGAPPAEQDGRIYEASAEELCALVRESPVEVRTLMVVGHSPGVKQLTTYLTGREESFPPGALAVLEVSEPWPDVAAGGCKLAEMWTP